MQKSITSSVILQENPREEYHIDHKCQMRYSSKQTIITITGPFDQEREEERERNIYLERERVIFLSSQRCPMITQKEQEKNGYRISAHTIFLPYFAALLTSNPLQHKTLLN